MKHFFDREGRCLMGAHKGRHHSEIPEGWIEWAAKNIQGFRASFNLARQEKLVEKPKPTGRTYIVKFPGRKFIK